MHVRHDTVAQPSHGKNLPEALSTCMRLKATHAGTAEQALAASASQAAWLCAEQVRSPGGSWQLES